MSAVSTVTKDDEKAHLYGGWLYSVCAPGQSFFAARFLLAPIRPAGNTESRHMRGKLECVK